ncbi:unnamed protein product [Ascophyllum nodosum]
MDAIYGQVWQAVEVDVTGGRCSAKYYDDGSTRRVAVKIIFRERLQSLRRRFAEDPLKEISALTILSDPGHPNVLQRDAALYDDEAVYLVTRYIDGGEIFKWIQEERGAYHQGKIDTVRNVFRQLVQGMQYTHSRGICHADMSLENALVDMRRENAYIIDYGMSLLMPVVTRDGHNRRRMSIRDSRTSKRAYRSPETSYGLAYDGVKVDVFSAGAMLFIMLTGSRAFNQPRWSDPRYKLMVLEGRIEQAINQDLQMLQLDANQAADLEEAVDLLRRMMARRPADRPLPENVLQHQWLAR